MRQPSDIVAAVTIYRRFSTGLLKWNVCAQTQTLFSHPTPFLSRVGKMARLIIGEKARGRIESYYIISGKFRGNKPAKINWIFRWAWPSPYFIYHSQRARAKWAFSLFSLGALPLRVRYLAWIRESTLAVTCVYIWTTVDQEGIRSCRLSHIAGVA